MALMDRKNPIQIYGPLGIKKFLVCCQQTLKSELTYQIEINEIIKPGIIVEEEQYLIETIKSNHTIESYSYAFEEKPQLGEFFPEKATALEIPEGELWAKLQKGETITTPKGKTINPHQVMGPNRQGIKIIYTGDTKPFDTFTTFANNADIIIHDCTFDDTLTTKAELNGHSTPSQAANQAKNSNAKTLILTHISARYPYTELLLEQAKKIFKNTIIAEDFYTLNIPTPTSTNNSTNTAPSINI
jgi:ribonuclease Z